MEKTKPYQVISGSVLKLIAVISMTIDHTTLFLLKPYPWTKHLLFTAGETQVTIYYFLRSILGRLAFPIYCFLLVEGMLHTKNKGKYLLSLAGFALISEIPWDLLRSGVWFSMETQTVMVTLFLGALAIAILESLKDRPLICGLLVIAIFVLTFFTKADYHTTGFVLILTIYAVKGNPWISGLVASQLLSYRAAATFLLMVFYNGQRGFIKGKLLKYAFYFYYPAHLMVLYLIGKALHLG